MKIAIIIFIAIVVIEQLSFGVNGCNKGDGNGNSNTTPEKKPKKFKYEVTLANDTITFNKKDKLGQGTAADVYAGETKDGIKVAVKVFRDKKTSRKAYDNELECYKKLGATISDKFKIYGIPPILYYGPGAGSRVLVMPKYKYTLSSLKANVIVSDEAWLSIMQQMVVAIKYMHSKGIIHGGINQLNMMVDLNQVYLIDYGTFKEVSVADDMLKMFLEICDFFKLKRFMKHKVEKVGAEMSEQKNEIIKEVIAKKTINSKYAEPLVEFAIEVVVAKTYNRFPYYDKLYRLLEKALYPEGDNGQRLIFDWVLEAEQAIAREIPTVQIGSIEFNNQPSV